MWIRYNPAAKYYEKSDNNGASWSQLPMSASSITEGTFGPGIVPPLPANIAYTNITNRFTVVQHIEAPLGAQLRFYPAGATINARGFQFYCDGGAFYMMPVDDSGAWGANYCYWDRSGNYTASWSSISVGGNLAAGNFITAGLDITASRDIRSARNLKVDNNFFCGAQGTVSAPGDMSVSQAAGNLATIYFGTDGANYHHRNGWVSYYMASNGYHYFYQGIKAAGTSSYMSRLALGADVTPLAVGDLVLARDAGSSGCCYFGVGMGHYLYFDGSKFNLTARLDVNSHIVANGNIHTQNGFLYPGHENGTFNSDKYICAHTYYGFFNSSQWYVAGYVWTVGIIYHSSTLAERKALRAEIEKLPDRESWFIQDVRFGAVKDDPAAANLGPATGFIHAKDEDDNDIRIPYWR